MRAIWRLSNKNLTVRVETNSDHIIQVAPPGVRCFIGQPLKNLTRWMGREVDVMLIKTQPRGKTMPIRKDHFAEAVNEELCYLKERVERQQKMIAKLISVSRGQIAYGERPGDTLIRFADMIIAIFDPPFSITDWKIWLLDLGAKLNAAAESEQTVLKSGCERVYDVIDGERDYQNSLGPDRTDGTDRTVGDYLTMFEHYRKKAVYDWASNPSNEQALHQIRKLAAIAVRCMEEHGAPEREKK